MVGCSKRSGRDKDVSFYRVPLIIRNEGELAEELTTERRRKWISAISRDDITEKKMENDRVCSSHFVSGKPASNWDKFNIDWVPTLNLGHNKNDIKPKDRIAAGEGAQRAVIRRNKRLEERSMQEKLERLNELGIPAQKIVFSDTSKAQKNRRTCPTEQASDRHKNTSDTDNLDPDCIRLIDSFSFSGSSLCSSVTESNLGASLAQPLTSHECSDKDIEDMMGACRLHDAGTQTEELDYIFKQKSQQPFDIDYFQHHDDRVRFYIGLHSFDILEAAYNFVAPHVTRKSLTLNKFQEFNMVLMKLRLNMPYQNLAYRFDISVSTVSSILFSWLLVMDVRLSPLINWPS